MSNDMAGSGSPRCPARPDMSNKPPQSRASELVVVTGRPPTPNDDVPAELAPRGLRGEAQRVVSRIEAAQQLSASVYPMAQGLYRLVSESGDEYIIDMDSYDSGEHDPNCLCEDFQYRCREIGIDCKHLLIIKRLINRGCLPPISSEPVSWVENTLDDLLEHIYEYRQPDDSRELALLAKEISSLKETPLEADVRELKSRFSAAQEQTS